MTAYLKALYAALAAFAVPFLGALTETSDHGSQITVGEWATAVIAGALAGLGVVVVPNVVNGVAQRVTPKRAGKIGGYSAIELLVIVILIILVIIVAIALADRL